MHWSPPLHHFILGSLLPFKCDDLSSLKTFMHGLPPPHHYIFGSILTFKHDDLSALRHLCMGPLHHTTISLIQFYHLSVVTFLHLSIYARVPPQHHVIFVQFQHSSVVTILHLNICLSPLPHPKNPSVKAQTLTCKPTLTAYGTLQVTNEWNTFIMVETNLRGLELKLWLF